MYKSANVNTKATFLAVFEDDGEKEITVHVFPPKLSVLNKLLEVNTESAESITDTTDALAKILSNNKERIKFDSEKVGELVDVADLEELLTDFFEWCGELKKK